MMGNLWFRVASSSSSFLRPHLEDLWILTPSGEYPEFNPEEAVLSGRTSFQADKGLIQELLSAGISLHKMVRGEIRFRFENRYHHFVELVAETNNQGQVDFSRPFKAWPIHPDGKGWIIGGKGARIRNHEEGDFYVAFIHNNGYEIQKSGGDLGEENGELVYTTGPLLFTIQHPASKLEEGFALGKKGEYLDFLKKRRVKKRLIFESPPRYELL